MSSNTLIPSPQKTTSDINPNEQSTSPVTHASTPTVPLRVDPVSTVFPDQTFSIAPKVKKEKLKKKKSVAKKKSSSTDVKKTPKLKRGESKVPLTMEDLYLKENPFNIPNVDANVESSAKDPKVADVEAALKGNADTPFESCSATVGQTKILEKGNTDETLKSVDDKSAEYPRVDDKNTASSDVCNTIVEEIVKIPIEKKNVVPDVKTSLGQQAVEQDVETSLHQQ
jgi:hypothetical protein